MYRNWVFRSFDRNLMKSIDSNNEKKCLGFLVSFIKTLVGDGFKNKSKAKSSPLRVLETCFRPLYLRESLEAWLTFFSSSIFFFYILLRI